MYIGESPRGQLDAVCGLLVTLQPYLLIYRAQFHSSIRAVIGDRQKSIFEWLQQHP